mgnify:CR=1 FL=1
MKRIGLLIVFFYCFLSAKAQIHELGFFIGGSNTIADIGPTKFVYANSPALGLIYKWNITTRYAIRASLINSKLKSYDTYAQDLSRFNRFIAVDNTINEFSLGFEVNFFEFNLHDDDKEFTPYVYAGVSYFAYDLLEIPLRHPAPGFPIEKVGGEMDLSIPAVVGVKASLSPLFVLSLETGIRYAFTDNIDGSAPDNTALQRGAAYNNDWYVFTGFTFSYTFGQIPCYCKEKK